MRIVPLDDLNNLHLDKPSSSSIHTPSTFIVCNENLNTGFVYLATRNFKPSSLSRVIFRSHARPSTALKSGTQLGSIYISYSHLFEMDDI